MLSHTKIIEKFGRTIAHWPLAAILTDHLAEDHPIVAANKAFLRMTEYSLDEVLGRNCRFLAGPKTEPEARKAIRAALTKGLPAFVELTNYRKNGQSFRNGLSLSPIMSEAGMPALYLGTQIDLSVVQELTGPRLPRAAHLVATLSPRRREMLEYLVAGYRNQEIADALNLSIKTVKMHRARLIEVLGVKTSAQAIRIGIQAGL